MKRLLLVLAALATLGAAPRGLTHYPRRVLDIEVNGMGYPLLRPDFTLDTLRCDSAARFDVLLLDASPLRSRPDIAVALHERNPQLVLIAYMAGGVWNNPHPGLSDSTHELYCRRWQIIRDHNALLYATDGTMWDAYDNVDRSNHRAMLALADLDASAALVPWVRGIFLDTFCPSILWEQTPTRAIDYRRAGFSCLADWDHAYHEGHRIYVERLRQKLGTRLIIGNGGPSGERDVLNGWMREGFPYQNGGDWDTNMLSFNGDPGYLPDAAAYLQPTFMMLCSPLTKSAAQNQKEFTFGLASATLGEGGYEQIGRDRRLHACTWHPEFDLDLGKPLGPAYRVGTSYIWRRDFSAGYVEVDSYNYTGRLVPR